MKRIKHFVAITAIVLGLGTSINASANNNNIEASLKQVIAKQSIQVTSQLSKQIKQSVQATLNEMTATKTTKSVSNEAMQVAVAEKQVSNKNNSTSEEE